MAIKIGTTDIQKCFIGTTPVKSIWSGDTQVRPSGWQPGVDTIVYYKFDGDIKDYSGNGYDLSGSGYTLNTGYVHLSQGRLYNTSSNIIYDNSSDYTISIRLRNFETDKSNTLYRCQAGVLSAYAPNISNQFPLTYLGVANGVLSTPVGTIMGTNALGTTYNDGAGNNTTIMVNGSTRTLVTVILDRANNVTYFYKNGSTTPEFTKNNAGISGDSPTTGIQIGIVGGIDYGGDARYYYGDIGAIILEKRKWDVSEIPDYFNQTKGDYGIS